MAFGTLDRFVIMLVPITLILSVAGVLILRPISKQLAELLLELRKSREPQRPSDSAELAQAMNALADRMDRLEERQDFSEGLITAPRVERTDEARFPAPR